MPPIAGVGVPPNSLTQAPMEQLLTQAGALLPAGVLLPAGALLPAEGRGRVEGSPGWGDPNKGRGLV